MNNGFSILIIGAGIFGVTAALELRKRGHRVTLADPGPLPHPEAASNDTSKFIRMDYGHDEFYYSLMEEAFKGWYEWNRKWSRSLYHETGGLFMVREEMEPGGFEYESFIRCQKRGYKLQRLTPELVKDFFPRISYGKYKDGYFNPKAGWVEAGALLKLLIEEAKNLGVLVKPGIKITHLLNEGERIVGASTEKGIQIKADYFLVAAGAWSSLLMPELKDLMCATGQPVFYVQLGDGMESQLPKYASTWLADISKTGWYGFPPLPHCWIKIANHGPGRKIHPDDPREVTKEDELHLRQFLTENIPILADALIVKTRLCPYTDTWDSNFYIDHVPNQPGLLVASGGSGHAFKFAPVLGTIIADVIERKPNPFAYRFAWREKGEITHEEERSE